MQTEGLKAICTPEELTEVNQVLTSKTVKLKRTFNQKWPDGSFTKYWRVIAPPTHRNYMSDLSIDGLKTWGIIR